MGVVVLAGRLSHHSSFLVSLPGHPKTYNRQICEGNISQWHFAKVNTGLASVIFSRPLLRGANNNCILTLDRRTGPHFKDGTGFASSLRPFQHEHATLILTFII